MGGRKTSCNGGKAATGDAVSLSASLPSSRSLFYASSSEKLDLGSLKGLSDILIMD